MNQLLYTISHASRKSWWQTIVWIGYHAVGSLMPIWGSYFLLRLYHQHFQLDDFVVHGEFALYAATFLAIALPQVARNIKDAKYVLGPGSVLFAVAGLVFSALIYSGVAQSAFTNVSQLAQSGISRPTKIDEDFLLHVSMALFLVSLGFAALVTLLENELANPNVRITEDEDQQQLDRKVSSKHPESAPGSDRVAEPSEEPAVPSEEDLAAEFKRKSSARGEGGGNG